MKRETDDPFLANNASRTANHASYPALDALLLISVFSLTLHPLVDPDFGWHLRAGLDLVKNGWRMPATDPYSHTVPEWPWVEHAWLTDGLIGLMYAGLGPIGPLAVILLFGAIATVAFLVAAGSARAGRTSRYLAAAIALFIALPFLGVRTQMITLLGLAVVLSVCWRYQQGRSAVLLALPPLFLVWGNLHGGFTAGLFLLGLIATTETLKALSVALVPASGRGRMAALIQEPSLARPRIVRLAAVTLLAALVTLMNPYGWRLHGEIYASLTDRFMMETLHEWQPLSLDSRAGLTYTIYLAALGLGLLLWYRRIEPTRWLITGLFGALSVLHWRNIPFFLLISVSLLAEVLAVCADRLAALLGPRHLKRWLLAATLAVALFAGTVGHGLVRDAILSGLNPAEYFRHTDYPIEAVTWIRTHPDLVGTRLYNDYGLGGFLLWWLPEVKIFIDGRMPAWRVGDRWIFYDYVALTAWDPPALGVLDKYRVDWALVGRNTLLDDALAQERDWREVYGDKKVTIYVRRK